MEMQYTLVIMEEKTRQALLHINRQFYDRFAGSFSATRGRVQSGVRRLMSKMASCEFVLDVGCGNGTLARALAGRQFAGRYLGVDMSSSLLSAARELLDVPEQGEYVFQEADLTAPGWAEDLPFGPYDWLVSFAVLHHLPGEDMRRQTAKAFSQLIHPEGTIAVSVWQWQNSPRLRKRVVPWGEAGIDPSALDEGDVLLDWRAEQQAGLRYVHTFTDVSLTVLAESAGFSVRESFYSDGNTGDLALYQIWQKGS